MFFVQYIEEPVQDAADLATFFEQTQMPIALDETLDQALSGQSCSQSSTQAGVSMQVQQLMAKLPLQAVRAFIVKPGVVGGFEATTAIAAAALKYGVQVGHQASSSDVRLHHLIFQLPFSSSLVYAATPGRAKAHIPSAFIVRLSERHLCAQACIAGVTASWKDFAPTFHYQAASSGAP